MRNYIHERANPRNKIHITTINGSAAASPSIGGRVNG
jgi:hypothetical protein